MDNSQVESWVKFMSKWCEHFGFPHKVVGDRFYWLTAIQTLSEKLGGSDFRCEDIEVFENL